MTSREFKDLWIATLLYPKDFKKPIDFFRNSTHVVNCSVAPVLRMLLAFASHERVSKEV